MTKKIGFWSGYINWFKGDTTVFSQKLNKLKVIIFLILIFGFFASTGAGNLSGFIGVFEWAFMLTFIAYLLSRKK